MSPILLVLLILCLGSQLDWGTVKIVEAQVRASQRSTAEAAISEAGGTVESRVRSRARGARPPGRRRPRRPFTRVSRFLGSTNETREIGASFEILRETRRILRERLSSSDRPRLTEILGAVRPLADNDEPVDAEGETIFRPPTIRSCPFPLRRRGCNRNRRFRTFTGVCNNLQDPIQGRSFTPFIRLLAPEYSDEGRFNEPRVAVDGKPLPSARLVSTNLFTPGRSGPPGSKVFTLFLMTVGQILDHDLTRTAISSLFGAPPGETEIECGEDGCDADDSSLACFPISIPRRDRAFSGRPCLTFVRTQGVPARNCRFGPRQQLNQLTHYIDASNIYGSTGREARALRDFRDRSRGKLKTTNNPARGCTERLLPRDPNIDDCVANSRACFTAGDQRVNENAALATLHTLFVRLHNDIEEKIHRRRPNFSGNRLYQETRRIVGAIWQNIVYNEYLPVILGSANIKRSALDLNFDAKYDRTVTAEITNVFATAAFRYSHSMIDDLIEFNNKNFNDKESAKLSTILQRPDEVLSTRRPAGCGPESITYGIIQQENSKVDRFFSKQITDKLFSDNPPNEPGTDLTALNVQRGRDHGLPDYNDWRKHCNLRQGRSFRSLPDIPRSAQRILERTYENVKDIDLFAGAMSETPKAGSLLGPTFSCLVKEQFERLRTGDRFFFTSDPNFTSAQRKEIKKMTLARVLCDTLEDVRTMQPWALLRPLSDVAKDVQRGDAYDVTSLYRGGRNERVRCRNIPGMDINRFF